jgi:hypothetical protein
MANNLSVAVVQAAPIPICIDRDIEQVVGDGSIICEAGTTETVLYAEIDLDLNAEAKTALDTDGHYSRADVFELKVDTHPKPGVLWTKPVKD